MAISRAIDNKRTKALENFDVQGQEVATGINGYYQCTNFFYNLYPLSLEIFIYY